MQQRLHRAICKPTGKNPQLILQCMAQTEVKASIALTCMDNHTIKVYGCGYDVPAPALNFHAIMHTALLLMDARGRVPQ